MDQVNKTIADAIERQGGNKSEIARKLGGISSQLLGQYASGRQKPKGDEFYNKWLSTFGEDLKNETYVSIDRRIDKQIQSKNITLDSSVIWSMMREANEERIKELKEHNAFLQRMIETSLGKLDRIERLSESTLADLKGSMKYQAEREAKGNLEKQNDIESHVSKLAGDALVVILSSNKSEVPYK